jgi:hypothetical protein
MAHDTLAGLNVAIFVTDGFESSSLRGGKTKPKMGFPGPVLVCLCLVASFVSLCRAQGGTLSTRWILFGQSLCARIGSPAR